MARKQITHFVNVLLISLLAITIACDDSTEPRSYFTRAFPKHPCSLVEVFGSSLQLINPLGDTVKWSISYQPATQTSIIIQEAETLFNGQASRLRGRFLYLSTIKTDTSYWYDVLEIDSKKNQLHGFLGKNAMLRIDRLIDNQSIPIKNFPDKEHFPYKLKSSRKAVHKIFKTILADTQNTFQLLQAIPKVLEVETNDPDSTSEKDEPAGNQVAEKDTNQIIQKVFPNPTRGVVNLVLHEDGDYTLKVTNISGKIISTTTFASATKQIDLSGLPPGTYYLLVEDIDDDLEAATKIVLE